MAEETKPEKMADVHVRILKSIDEKLERLCTKTGASKGWHIEKALGQYFRKEGI